VIRNADWIIDLGPEGGDDGGRIVAQGTPEQVARVKKSYTGQALGAYFGKGRKVQGTIEPRAAIESIS
jgi:excinuclease ABC subunit A